MSKKVFKAKVISTKMQKTVVVKAEIPKFHPIYKKPIRNTRKFMARDEIGVAVNDDVLIEEIKPYSKRVCWKVIKKFTNEGKE